MPIRRHLLLLTALLGLYLSVLAPFTSYMKNKPYAEKLGLLPRAEVLRVVSADQKQLWAAAITARVILYFGSLMGKEGAQLAVPPDYPSMSRAIHASVLLDPYSMDNYYFAQAILAWDVKQYQLANNLLERGMKYRTWDWYLPFFAGFNYGFFLKDYQKAAQMYMRAGELSGNPLFKNLAGRYLQQSGQTEVAIAYLSTMEKGARDPAIRKAFHTRLQAFQMVYLIEKARDRFKAERGALPARVQDLVAAGYLKTLPVDPYGGTFYLEPNGSVTTTSKFAAAGAAAPGKKDR
jgi:tetratricopeptide (TPR) repeat protein